MYYETITETPFYRVVDGVVKGQDGTLSTGYQLPYPAPTTNQNGKTYAVFGNLPGAVKPDNAIETKFLNVVDDTNPDPDPDPDPEPGEEAYTLTVTVEKPGFVTNTHTITDTLKPSQ